MIARQLDFTPLHERTRLPWIVMADDFNRLRSSQTSPDDRDLLEAERRAFGSPSRVLGVLAGNLLVRLMLGGHQVAGSKWPTLALARSMSSQWPSPSMCLSERLNNARSLEFLAAWWYGLRRQALITAASHGVQDFVSFSGTPGTRWTETHIRESALAFQVIADHLSWVKCRVDGVDSDDIEGEYQSELKRMHPGESFVSSSTLLNWRKRAVPNKVRRPGRNSKSSEPPLVYIASDLRLIANYARRNARPAKGINPHRQGAAFDAIADRIDSICEATRSRKG